ncbi:unnamed protein product [Rhizoctonia solani]|uniref:Uncharacterized protein n=1 Tax=Rhizoctonia solani TaxID=456999 RepID=A0A8H3H535_9AGAM|nr:unnamed protein product [Rhizoctonia solani]CAE6482841.1 unnamed protein product [Rhizoctonia solani]
MPPQQFMVQLQHGIVGGFAPPTPNALHRLIRSSGDPSTLCIESMVRPEGTPSLQPNPTKNLPIGDSSHASKGLVDELHSILKEIPTESPPGSEDIYGMDTSIMWMSEDLEWMNGGPQGCGGGTSEVQPSEEQKAKFKRAVEIVTKLTELEN